MNWQKVFRKKSEIVLATFSKKSGPHAIVVISQGFVDGKLIIDACQTKTTLENIKKDNRVCVVGMGSGKYIRLKGTAKLFTSGKYFNIAKEKDTNFKVSCSIVITPKEVFDLDKVKKINL